MLTEAFEGSIHETQERISTDYVDLFGIHEIWLGHLKGNILNDLAWA
jgi:aryl-alcohol dehydrogenase-like predicted oxidoreductase